MEIIAKKGQSLFDIAILLTGSASAAYEIAVENNLQIDSEINAGTILEYSGEIIDQDTIDYYKLNNVNPATQLTDDEAHIRIFDYTFEEIFE